MAKSKSDRLALISLILAILSSAFAIYQWWSSNRQERVRAAVDVSTKYIDEAINPYVLINQYHVGAIPFTEYIKAKNFLARLEYASYMANNGLLDSNYLTKYLICDIFEMVSKKDEDDIKHLADSTSESEEFVRRQKITCERQPAPAPATGTGTGTNPRTGNPQKTTCTCPGNGEGDEAQDRQPAPQ